MNQETKELIKRKREVSKRIIELDNRKSLTPLEASEADDLSVEYTKIKKELNQPEARQTLPGAGPLGGSGKARGNPFGIRYGNQSKSYDDLFGSTRSATWDDRDCSFYQAALSGKYHPGLTTRGMSETVPSDGGYLVPDQYAKNIHNVSLENELVMPMATVVPMGSNELHLPGLQIGDHSANLFGGFIAYYKDEASAFTQANPKTRDVQLNAHKLTGYMKYSSELQEDVANFDSGVEQAMGKGLSWYRDKSFLKGTGAGQPLGIKNAGCLIEVAKEDGQAADTLVYSNLTKMLSRLWSGSMGNSVWIAHPTTIPQLLALTVTIGDGGSHYPVLNESNGKFKMLTRPVIFSEKMEPLGDKFDIALCDFSQYIIGLRKGMSLDRSPHVAFSTDEIWLRLRERHDGMPLWDEALTLEDGSTTVSPFVTLAERAAG
jgi:HK97 family phage major capsid protein